MCARSRFWRAAGASDLVLTFKEAGIGAKQFVGRQPFSEVWGVSFSAAIPQVLTFWV